MKVYKLTDRDKMTKNNTKWGKFRTHTTVAFFEFWRKIHLCSSDCLHAYENPYIAILVHRMHVSYDKPILWEASAMGRIVKDDWKKLGSTILTTIREIEFPSLSHEQKVEITIRYVMAHYKNLYFNGWAEKWLLDKSLDVAVAMREDKTTLHIIHRAYNLIEDCADGRFAVNTFMLDRRVGEILTYFNRPVDIMPIIKQVLGYEYVEYGVKNESIQNNRQ